MRYEGEVVLRPTNGKLICGSVLLRIAGPVGLELTSGEVQLCIASNTIRAVEEERTGLSFGDAMTLLATKGGKCRRAAWDGQVICKIVDGYVRFESISGFGLVNYLPEDAFRATDWIWIPQ